MRNITFLFLTLSFLHCHADLQTQQSQAALQLFEQYNIHCEQPSDIFEHIPVLRQLSKECSTVVEIGVRSITSTWGILQGLSESPFTYRAYLGIDIDSPDRSKLSLAISLAEKNGIHFQFWQKNDMTIDIETADMLFIDSLHTYCHLTFALEKFCPMIRKYIVLHNTSEPWGSSDDNSYNGNYSEYPAFIDRHKKGLWPAVVDFLARHPEWCLQERRQNNHGLIPIPIKKSIFKLRESCRIFTIVRSIVLH